ncbi:succinate dehydrogenase [ubiquinone] cytochrome b small subunit, mitochondrial [Monosporozyma servazzii]
MFVRSRPFSVSAAKFITPTISRSFQTTAKRSLTIPFLPILPQKPGGVVGTPNDSYKPPTINKFEGSIHWWTEKAFTLTTLPLVTLATLSSGPLSTASDSILSVALLGYCYMEFQSCIADYITARVYGKWHNYAMYLLGAGSLVSLFGIYKLETENDGITGLVKGMWKAQPIKEEAKK